MLRLVGIILVCLSTLVGPAVHAGTMASQLSVSPHTFEAGAAPVCGRVVPMVAPAPFDAAPAVHEKADGKRCQAGIVLPIDQPDFSGFDTGPAKRHGGGWMPPGIDVAPPHGPPRNVLAVTFA